MKIAIIHYWLVSMRGGEKVLEALCELYPEADIYTNALWEEKISDRVKSHRIFTTFVNVLPRAKFWYQRYLFLMPLALEQLDLREYDLVISSESGPAKGVITRPDALHVCYCHSPMRYIWDLYPDYLKGKGFVTKNIMKLAFHYLRIWDVTSAARVDYFIANSNYVASRIKKYYRRESEVIYPPVEVERIAVSQKSGDYYLWVGQLVQYKRPDIAIEAFNRNGKKLIVIGEGEEGKRLKAIAHANILFLGKVADDELHTQMEGCKALIFPGIEDFGIVPVEAMAAGKPVIAFNRGGASETVIDGQTGILFDAQSPEALNKAIELFERKIALFDRARIRAHAISFSKAIFMAKIDAEVKRCLNI